MDATSLLVLRSLCDFGTLLQIDETRSSETVVPRHIPKSITQASLECDILLVPELNDDVSVDVSSGHSEFLVFPKQKLHPCGMDNVLSFVRSSDSYMLSLSDCSFQAFAPPAFYEETFTFLASVTDVKWTPHGKISSVSTSSEVAFVEVFLELDPVSQINLQGIIHENEKSTYSDVPEYRQATVQTIDATLLKANSDSRNSSTEEEIPGTTTSSTDRLSDESPNEPHDETKAQIQRDLVWSRLELRLRRELETIETVISAMLFLPSLVLVVVAVGIFGHSPYPFFGWSTVSGSTSASRSALSCIHVDGWGKEGRTKSKQMSDLRFGSGRKEVMLSPGTKEHPTSSPSRGDRSIQGERKILLPPADQRQGLINPSTENPAKEGIPSPLSPRSQWSLEWESKARIQGTPSAKNGSSQPLQKTNKRSAEQAKMQRGTLLEPKRSEPKSFLDQIKSAKTSKSVKKLNARHLADDFWS